jgi:ribosomal protein L30/L7E
MLQRSGLGNLLGGFERARSMIPTLPSPRSALSGLGLPLDNLEQQARSMIPTLPSPRSALGGLGLPLDNLEQQARSMIPTLPSPRSALSGLGLPLDNLEQRAGSMLTQATSGMPQLPLLQQMNWQSAQQAAGLSNLGLPDFGDDSEMAGAADIPDTASESVESPAGGRPATELPLLKPTRPEQQAAPEQSQSAAADGEAAPGSPGSTSGAATGATDPAGAAGKQGKHDIEQLAQQVYARLRHRLLVDRERLGPF